MANAEVKLGKSLDAIIEDNKKKATGSGGARSKPRGVRVDGAKKPIRIQGGSNRPTQREARAPKMLSGRGGGPGLGVRGAGVQKRTGRAPAYDFDAMDVDDYGAAPPRRQQRPKGGGGGGYGGRAPRAPIGAVYNRRVESPVPRGDSDNVWQHDLYDPRQAPARRVRAPISQGRGQAGPAKGFTLTISNLDYTVSEADIKELFETCGPLVESFIHFDNSGRSNGIATVIYERKESAEKAIKEYDGVLLDKKELHIEYAEDQPVQKLSGGVLSRLRDNNGGSGGGGGTFRRALDALPVRGMGDGGSRGMGGSPRRRPQAGGVAYSGRMGGGGRGAGGRLRSTVGRSKADLDAELDTMQE